MFSILLTVASLDVVAGDIISVAIYADALKHSLTYRSCNIRRIGPFNIYARQRLRGLDKLRAPCEVCAGNNQLLRGHNKADVDQIVVDHTGVDACLQHAGV